MEEAEKYLIQASHISVSSATVQEHLGEVYQKQGRPELAKEAWEKALSLAKDPDQTARLKSKLGGEKK